MADPRFPVGGRGPCRGAWTHEAVTFQNFFMSKRKNLDPGGRAWRTPPRSANDSPNEIHSEKNNHPTRNVSAPQPTAGVQFFISFLTRKFELYLFGDNIGFS